MQDDKTKMEADLEGKPKKKKIKRKRMQDDKTKMEYLTKLEEKDLTKREIIPAHTKKFISLRGFKECYVSKELPAKGAEADNFLLECKNRKLILKLYRKGINPNIKILTKLMEISRIYREHMAEIFEVGYNQELGRYYEVMEYIPGGNLKDLINELSQVDITSKEKIVDRIILEIAEALKVLHENDIIHRDLKPSNILIRDRNSLDLVLIDFGIARQTKDDVSKVATTTFKGSIYYIAPEEISGYFGKEIDWWHLGIIVYELLIGKNPFAGLSEPVVLNQLVTKGIQIPNEVPDKYKLLLKGVLTRNYEKRWGYEQLKKWLKGEKNIPVFYEEIEKGYKKNYSLDEWSKHGIPENSAWRTLKLSPVKVKTFITAGFGFVDAKRWVEAGWESGRLAKRWFEAGFEPEESLLFEQLGLSVRKVKTLKKLGITAHDLLQIKNFIKDFNEFTDELIDLIKEQKKTSLNLKNLIEQYKFWHQRGFTIKEAENWMANGFNSTEAKLWQEAGFTFFTAKSWKDHGFLPFEAKQWQAYGYSASDAKLWINSGFKCNASEAKSWDEAGFNPSEAKNWYEAGFTPSNAKVWHQAGFRPLEAKEWLNAKFSLVEAKKWKEIGIKKPSEIKEWQNFKTDIEIIKLWAKAGFNVAEAKSWDGAGFSPSEAKEWHNAGFTPSKAKEWAKTKFNALEAKKWYKEGFSSLDAKEWHNAGFDSSTAKEWQREGFNPINAKEWSKRCEPFEARRWYEANFTPELFDRYSTTKLYLAILFSPLWLILGFIYFSIGGFVIVSPILIVTFLLALVISENKLVALEMLIVFTILWFTGEKILEIITEKFSISKILDSMTRWIFRMFYGTK